MNKGRLATYFIAVEPPQSNPAVSMTKQFERSSEVFTASSFNGPLDFHTTLDITTFTNPYNKCKVPNLVLQLKLNSPLACSYTRNAYSIDSHVYAALPSSCFKLPLHLLIQSAGEGTHDNYAYLVIDDKSKDAVIIDPANADDDFP